MLQNSFVTRLETPKSLGQVPPFGKLFKSISVNPFFRLRRWGDGFSCRAGEGMLGQESPVGSHVSTGLGTMLLGVSGNCDDREVTSLADELPSEPDSENDTCIERGESGVSGMLDIYSFQPNLIKCQSFTYDLQLTFTKTYTTLACCKITDNMENIILHVWAQKFH